MAGRKSEGSGDENSKKGPSVKVLWYLPIIPRFKRLFANRDDAKGLTWHCINAMTVSDA